MDKKLSAIPISLITVADDRYGRKGGKYGATQKKIEELLNGWIPQYHFGMSLFGECDPLMVNLDPGKNGRVYKPWTIRQFMNNMDDGDFLIYNDCSPELWPDQIDLSKYDLNVIKELTIRNNNFLVGFVKWDDKAIGPDDLGAHTHDNFTLESCIKIMDGEQYRHSFLCASGMICIRKVPFTVALVDKWLNFNRIKECSCLNYSDVEDSYWDLKPGRKFGNRHDQSVLSMVLNQADFDYCDIVYNQLNPYNFLNYCIPGHEYKFINSNRR